MMAGARAPGLIVAITIHPDDRPHPGITNIYCGQFI